MADNNDRLNLNGNDNNKEEMRNILTEMTQCAIRLYDLMQQGMTIDFTFPDTSGLLIPNQPPKLKRLIITRPKLHLNIKADAK